MAKRRNRLSKLAAVASAVRLIQYPGATLSLSPIVASRLSDRSSPSHSCTPARSARGDLNCGGGGAGGGSTALCAFWTRGSDPDGGDEAKRSSNTLWRRILPGNGTGGGGGNAESEPGSATGRMSSPALGRRKRTTGRSRPSTGSNRSRTKSSSARYFYSAALVSELCPSFPESGAEECLIDDSVYGRYDDDGCVPPEEARPKPGAARLVEDSVDAFIHRHAEHTLNLRVTSDASKLKPVLLRGDVGTVCASFDRVAFPALKVSGGGRISAAGLSLNAASFVPALGRFVRRFRRPFEFHAEDCVLTQEDLRASRCIRNGLANLFTRILKHAVMRDTSLDVVRIDRGASVAVDVFEVLESSMLSCSGTITTIVGTQIPFEVQTGLRVSSVGHVLHFPGLEVTLNPRSPLQFTMPLHVLLPVDLDIGDNALVENVEIDGRRKQVRISMRATVTPARSRKTDAVGYRKRRDVISARYSCDVGQWLTRLGRF